MTTRRLIHGVAGRWAVAATSSLGLSACLIEINPLYHGEIEIDSDTTDSEAESGDNGDNGENGDNGNTGSNSGGSSIVSEGCSADAALVACYQFETSDEIVDGSVHGNDGIAASLGLGAGRSGLALDCATSEAVQVPDSSSLDVPDELTMAMWVRPESVPQFGRDVWFDNSGQYGLMLDATDGYVCRVLTSAGSSQVSGGFGSVPLGIWTHVACTYDGSAIGLYADGEQVAVLGVTGSVFTGDDDPVTIGSNSPTFDERCTGQIDDVHVYDRALTDAEIATLAGF